MAKRPTTDSRECRSSYPASPNLHFLPRTIRAPRGTQLTCKNWLIEAAYRMLQNNLDPEVAFDRWEQQGLIMTAT